jgi:transposase-like protein
MMSCWRSVREGLTTEEISAHLAEIYGASGSKETVSRIANMVFGEMNDWAVRPCDATSNQGRDGARLV